jgi:hypothetical protein
LRALPQPHLQRMRDQGGRHQLLRLVFGRVGRASEHARAALDRFRSRSRQRRLRVGGHLLHRHERAGLGALADPSTVGAALTAAADRHGARPEFAASGDALARSSGPLQLIDLALLTVRRARPAQLWRAWLAGLPCALMLLLLYYLEAVEGFRTPRPLLAAGLVAAFWYRFVVLARLSREFVYWLRPGLPLSAAEPSWPERVGAASLAAFGLWLWAWPLIAVGRLAGLALLGMVPLLALRGAFSPSFMARSACAPARPGAVFLAALDDTRGARATMLMVELGFSVAWLALFGNLFALIALGLLLANSVLGLDVAFLKAFVSPDNEFMLLLVLGGALWLLEPLRAALSALAFSEARGRNEGADLQAAIDALAGPAPAPVSMRSRALLALLLCGAASGSLAHADDPARSPERQVDQAGEDTAVRARLARILARGEFHEFDAAEADRLKLGDLLERMFGERDQNEAPPPGLPHFELQMAPWFVLLLALIVLLLVIGYVTLETRRANPQPKAAIMPNPSGSPAPPSEPLDPLLGAARLAETGDFRAALRLLYLGALITLAQARTISLSLSQTNGQYLRAIPSGTLQEHFGALTQFFEARWYGRELCSAADYAEARRLIAALQAGVARALEPKT